MRIKQINGLFSGTNTNQDKQNQIDRILFYLLLFVSFFTVVIIYITANSPYDTGDGIVHYQIARYSWKYPHLFLEWWGKPFFTLVSSPFAQFGMKGFYIFQALNAAIISFLLYKIASKLNLKYLWIIPVFVFFAPIFLAVMNSGLVEIFFGTIFTLSAWLVFSKRYYASALVASLLPYVRPEAYVVMPLLILIYAYRRKYLAIPLLSAASLIYTFIGYFHFKDILWIIHQNYKLVGDNYAGMKGSYLHYFGLYNQIWGPVYAIFLIIGTGIILVQVFKLLRGKSKYEFVVEVFLLFLGNTVGCFILHSLLYAMPGILNNLGMTRYLATLIPSSALIALIGLNIINIPSFAKYKPLKFVIIGLAIILMVRSSFAQWYYPFKPFNEQYVMNQMANYIKSDLPDFKKVYFFHPLFPYYADLDPYDLNKVEVMWSADHEALNKLPENTLILWESHFMKGEVKIPFEMLLENPDYIMLKHYKYSVQEIPFEAALFIRANSSVPVQQVPTELVYPTGRISGDHTADTKNYNFENDTTGFRPWLDRLTSFSGKEVLTFTPETEFGPTFQKKIADFNNDKYLKSVILKFNIYQTDTINDLVGVIEIKDKDKQVSYEGLRIETSTIANQWNAVELHLTYPETIKNEESIVNIYIWNQKKQNFYIDDFQVTFEAIP